MKPKVYMESSVISYLTARPTNDLVSAARQTITEAWWTENLQHFAVFVSELVEQEIAQGHPDAAARRLAITAQIKNLSISEEAQEIAQQLLSARAVPENSEEDALHIGIAAANGIDFLLTWNFRHINNASTKAAIRQVIEGLGYRCPELCSPEELRKMS
uniref:PIN domain-containing protein n=1 Tax=Candidatus Kentrum sp. FM TaxID=2126340 RepID=A0A450TH04_9GAMM|nr:MAG: hypothetical protein BECKFM1743C_GA0114222_104276 [Candidatus Kentron sp. FM]VFJ68369.1 MAG: hypothetical protein BECKFM1743A_GA0114220_104717 [Candidatus Kentron sp. FM]VFK17222.1 MAG: hypothetical protein BECKFM1743B_GA0114221_104676 [Candidatus Kentron sp. FM]